MTLEEQYHIPAVDMALVPGTLRGFRAWRFTPSESWDSRFWLYPVHVPPAPAAATGWVTEEQVDHLYWRRRDSWVLHGNNTATCNNVDIDRAPALIGMFVTAIRHQITPKLCDGAPGLGCTCGFYARYAMDYTGNALEMGIGGEPELLAWGSIQASGRIVMSTGGFRAQHARIEALVLPKSARRGEKAHARPIPVYNTMEELLVNHPPQDVSALIGTASL